MQLSIDSKEFDKFLMVGDKVLVKPTNPQVKKKDNRSAYISLQAHEGDLAVYMQSAAYEVSINQEKFLILPHSAILMLVRDKDLFE